jgi:hypothetical protein
MAGGCYPCYPATNPAHSPEKRDRELYVETMREKEDKGMSKHDEYLGREVPVD